MYMGNKKNYNAIAAISIAILCTAVSIGLFLYKFGFNLNTPIKNWIDTATYFNNLLSPIFLFITVLLLYWSWRDTKQGLELQREDNLFNTITTTFENYSKPFTILCLASYYDQWCLLKFYRLQVDS